MLDLNEGEFPNIVNIEYLFLDITVIKTFETMNSKENLVEFAYINRATHYGKENYVSSRAILTKSDEIDEKNDDIVNKPPGNMIH